MAMLAVAATAQWTEPVEVRHELAPCVSYRARLAGEYVMIEVKLAPGWHTFSIDNEKRALEKLAGKQSLGIDRPTEIKLSDGLELAGPWMQTPVQDFSKPELRWFAFGYEEKAMFAAKVRRTGPGPGRIGIRGQACTDTICKNIDVAIALPFSGSSPEADVSSLEAVR
jgi:DsbC/DsbD-like thiol-disulfide interchange protein